MLVEDLRPIDNNRLNRVQSKSEFSSDEGLSCSGRAIEEDSFCVSNSSLLKDVWRKSSKVECLSE